MRARILTRLLASALLLCGCNQDPPQSTGPVNGGLRITTMQIGQEQFTLEIADTAPSRETGLMHRSSMPANHGMIFVFADEQPRAFWMRNTLIPLDILYLDRTGKVVSIHSMMPLDLTSTPSAGPAKFAIELNQGAAARAGVRPGDQLQIPAEAQEPRDSEDAEKEP